MLKEEKELYEGAIRQVAQDLGMSIREVSKIYRSFWKAVREYICSLPLKDDLTDDAFQALRPNVNIPSIGKLHVTLDRYRRVKKAEEYRLQKIKENAENNKD